MDAPSMVQRSGDKIIVRSVVSGDQLFVNQGRNANPQHPTDRSVESDEETVDDLVINEDVEQDIDEEEDDEDNEDDSGHQQSPQNRVHRQLSQGAQMPQSQQSPDDEWRQRLVKENLMQLMNQNLDTESLRWLLFNNNNSLMANKNILGGQLTNPTSALDDMITKEEGMDGGAGGSSGGGGNASHLPQCKIKRNYSCNNCSYFTQNPRQYLMHLRDTHGEKLIIHECKHCIYASRHYQKLVRHMKMVHGLSVDHDGSHLAVRKRGGLSLHQQQQQQQQFNSQFLLNQLAAAAASSAKRARSAASTGGSSVSGGDEINNNSVEMIGGGGVAGGSGSGGGGSVGEAKGGPRSLSISSSSSRSEIINPLSGEDQLLIRQILDGNSSSCESDENEDHPEQNVGGDGEGKGIGEGCDDTGEEEDTHETTAKQLNPNNFNNSTKREFPAKTNSLSVKPIETLLCDRVFVNCCNVQSPIAFPVNVPLCLLQRNDTKNLPPKDFELPSKTICLPKIELLPIDTKTTTTTTSTPTDVSEAVFNRNNPRKIYDNNPTETTTTDDNNHCHISSIHNNTPNTTTNNNNTGNCNDHCKKATPNNNNNNYLSNHNPPTHSGDTCRQFKCTVCDFEAASRELLAAHEATDHIKTKFFRCTKCNYVTHIRTRFSKHVKYHSMPMIKCNLCDFRTPYKWNLDRHMKNHGGSGPFKCSACNFTADIKQSLTVHEMNHHDPPVISATAAAAATNLLSQHLQSQQRRNRVGGSDNHNQSDLTDDADLTSGLAFHFLETSNMLTDSIMAAAAAKKSARPIPNLIPIQGQPGGSSPTNPSTSALNLCSKSIDSQDSNSDDGGSGDENSNPVSHSSAFKKKHGSFFDKLKEKIGTNGDSSNLTCPCSHTAKCLSELFIHQKTCQKFKQHQMNSKSYTTNLIANKNSSRCQYCRHRCKSSADLVAHMQNCENAQVFLSNALNVNIEQDSASELDNSEKMALDSEDADEPAGKQIFVWNIPKSSGPADEAGSATGSEGNNADMSMFSPAIKQEKMDDFESGLDMHSTFRQSPGPSDSPRHHQPAPQLLRNKNDPNSSTCLKKVFKCPHCSFWASTASRFHVHIVGHLNKKPFECSLCAYRSNWRWDITKHIRLKTIRDPGHKTAKVLMNDETGRRNYTKYNKYITLMKVTESDGNLKLMKSGEMTPNQEASLQSPHDNHLNMSSGSTSGGSANSSTVAKPANMSTVQKLLNDAASANLLKLSQAGFTAEDLLASSSELTTLLSNNAFSASNQAMGAQTLGEKKPTTFKCKKCNFKHPNRAVVQEHVKGHYRAEEQQQLQHQQLSKSTPAVEITPIYNTQNNNIVSGISVTDANLLLANSKTLSNLLASQSLLPIIQAAAAAGVNNNNSGQPNANGIVMMSSGLGAGTVDGNGLVVGGGGNNNNQTLVQQQQASAVATLTKTQQQPPGLLMSLASNTVGKSGVGAQTPNICVKILPKSPAQLLLQQAQMNNNNNNILGPQTAQQNRKPINTTLVNNNGQAQANNPHSNDHGEMDEASSGGTTVGQSYRSQLSYRCGHCQQVSNWKHVIQRHCRLKHGGNINIEQFRNHPGGPSVRQTTDRNNTNTATGSNVGPQQQQQKTSLLDTANSLQIPPSATPPRLAPLLHSAVTSITPFGSGANHSKEMQEVQQRFSSLINSISSGVVSAGGGAATPVASGNASVDGNGKKQYECGSCSYVTDNKSQYSYHKSLHKPLAGDELKCDYCQYTTTKKTLLTQHMRIHQSHPDDVIVVESEGHSVFPKEANNNNNNQEDTSDLNRQNADNAPPAKRKKAEYICPHCPYSDANQELVNDHKQFHFAVSHERLKCKCEFCDFNAHSEKTMKDHRKLHFLFMEKSNAAAVEFCTTYDKLKLYVSAGTTPTRTGGALGASRDKKIYDEEEIENENPWMSSGNSSNSGSIGGSGGGAGKGGFNGKGASAGAASTKLSTEQVAKAAINV